MIPYAILSGKLNIQGDVIEIRALDLSIDSITFRLSHKYDELLYNAIACGAINNREQLELYLKFFSQTEYNYIPYATDNFSIAIEETDEFYTIYRIIFDDPKFESLSRQLSNEYMNFISIKQNDPDAVFLPLTRLNHDVDCNNYPESFEHQKKQIFSNHKTDAAFYDLACHIPETAISLDRPMLWNRFLESDVEEFSLWCWENLLYIDHPFAKRKITHVYVGNQYCDHLFPEETILKNLIRKCISLNIKPVFVFSPVCEMNSSKYEDLIDLILREFRCISITDNKELTASDVEFVVNDWGMLQLISNKHETNCRITLGNLINKRRKDSRIPFRKISTIYSSNESGSYSSNESGSYPSNDFGFYSFEEEYRPYKQYSQNGLYDTKMQELLKKEYNITKYSYDSCAYPFSPAAGNHVLHLPYYNLNTATHCTTYAQFHNGDRSCQQLVKECPEYCSNNVFLYPDGLNMVGKYNTIFGIDTGIFSDFDYAEQILKASYMRIVFEFL